MPTIYHVTLLDSEVVLENKTNPHCHGTFILVKKIQTIKYQMVIKRCFKKIHVR